jgi:flagellar hook-length control protein FliK
MTSPISSLNAERARVDALAGSSPADGDARNGAFADLLRGHGQSLPLAAPPTLAAPASQGALSGGAYSAAGRTADTAYLRPETGTFSDPQAQRPSSPSQNEIDARDHQQQTAAASRVPQRRASDTPKTAHAEQDKDRADRLSKAKEAGDPADPSAAAATAAASAAPPAQPAETLAHWLLGAAAAGRAAASDTLPPPNQAAATGDGTDAASFTQDLLQGLRGAAGRGSERSWGRLGSAGSASALGAGAAGAPSGDAGTAQDAAASTEGAGRFFHGAAGHAGAHALHSGPTPGLTQTQDDATARPGTDRAAERLGLSGGVAESTGNALLAAGGLQEPGAARSFTAGVAEQAIQTPVGAAGFGDEVAVSIAKLAADGVHEARLQLNPTELGPLAVRIEVADGAARIGIGAAHESTRQLLEATLPALAEAFKADGLTLASSQVDAWSPQSPAAALVGSGFDTSGFSASGGGGQGAQQQALPGRPDGYGSAVGAVGAYGDSAGAVAGAGAGTDPLWSGAARRGLGGLDLYA